MKTFALCNWNWHCSWTLFWVIKGLVKVFNWFWVRCICKTGTFVSYMEKNPLGKRSHGNSSYLPPTFPQSLPLGRAGRGGSFYGRKDAVGPCLSPLTVVYLCNKWNIHRGAAVTARLHKSRGTQRALQTSVRIWLASATRTTELCLGPVNVQHTSTKTLPQNFGLNITGDNVGWRNGCIKSWGKNKY